MKNDHRVLLGWREGRLYGIDEVEKGLACRCICPACKGPLIARKGTQKRHHFAHQQQQGCVWANETILHLLAKRILAHHIPLRIPPVPIPRFPDPLIPSSVVWPRRVWAERRYGRKRPDLAVIVANNQWLNIEIAVTHFTDPKKVAFYRRRHWNALEIDCSDLIEFSGDRRALTARLTKRLSGEERYKKWLYHHRQALFLRKLDQLAALRKVRHYTWRNRHYYNVYACPQRKRTKKSALDSQVYFASLTQDCWHCPYLLSQNMGTSGEKLYPESILCWGHLHRLWEEERKKSRFTSDG